MIKKALSLVFVIATVFTLLVIAQRMPSGATLRGRFVYEDTGLPVRRAWVGLTLIKSFRDRSAEDNANAPASNYGYSNGSGDSGEDGAVVLTGDNGEFVIKDVDPGVYFPFVRQAGIYNPKVSDASDPAFRQFTVVGNEEIEVDIAVRRGGAVEGRITYQDGSPALGVSVFLAEISKTASGGSKASEIEEDEKSVETDDRGIYRFSGLGGGEYYVYASEPVVHTDRSIAKWDGQIEGNARQSMLKVYYPQSYSKNTAAKVSVQFGQELPNVDIVIPNHPFAELSGMVVSQRDKTPISGYNVSFEREDSESGYDSYGSKQVVTDESGRWSFRDLLPGKYTLEASRKTRYGYIDEEVEAKSAATKYGTVSMEIDIVEGINDNIVFELPVAASIAGTIEYEEKPPEGFFSYMFVRAFDEKRATADSAFTPGLRENKTEIEFLLDDLPAGSFLLDVSTFNGPYIRSITLNGEDISNSRIKVTEGQAVEGVRIILATDFGTLDGLITNPVVPVARYVYLTPVDFENTVREAGAVDVIKPDGTFQISAKPGRYYLISREFDDEKAELSPDEVREAWEEWTRGAEIVELKSRETIKVTITLD